MKSDRGAILAVLCVLAAAGQLPEPLHVRFRLTDGVQVRGEMTAWDEEGFDGSFGRRLWVELATDDVWRLYRHVMDTQDAEQWIDLGRLLLVVPDGAPRAERAFERALHTDPDSDERIERARQAAARMLAERKERADRRAEERLRTRTPEAREWPATPWPALTDDQWEQALGSLREEGRSILGPVGAALPVETPEIILYSDLERLEAARWAVQFDGIVRRLKALFGVDREETVFWGKAVVLLFAEQDRFRLVEAERFGQLVPLRDVGMCHPQGPRVFLSFHRADDDEVLLAALAHEATHAFMHRYRSPRRLPAWANEGLAEHMAARVLPEARCTVEGRQKGLDFVRAGGSVAALLSASYDEGTWPEGDEAAEAVGGLLIELMVRQNPQGFVAWVDAVKAGEDWPSALTEKFGVAPARLADTAAHYYRVNN